MAVQFFPSNVLLTLCSYLDVISLFSASQTCKHLMVSALDNKVWNTLLYIDFGVSLHELKNAISPREAYRQHYSCFKSLFQPVINFDDIPTVPASFLRGHWLAPSS
mmetsp:Transcript_31473/g.46096  ORF Transcript_31473/g.46096 Transcript_31473/m.46096 type:complete len:106 (-) Transcript_31473:261-578(-)